MAARSGKVSPGATFALVNVKPKESCFTFHRQPGNLCLDQHASTLLVKRNTSGQLRRLCSATYFRHRIMSLEILKKIGDTQRRMHNMIKSKAKTNLCLASKKRLDNGKTYTRQVKPAGYSYTDIPAMYCTVWMWPIAIRLWRSNFIVRTGQLFLTIWPPTEPASREVR